MKPMALGRSILFTLLPALLFGLLFWKGMPFADKLGKPLLYSHAVLYGFFCFQWMAFALWLYRREKHPPGSFRSRFRLEALSGKAWVWCGIIAAVLIASETLLASTAEWIQQNYVTPPKYYFRMMDPDPSVFMEISLAGNWLVPLVFLAITTFRIFCEELWFRGTMLPRQEAALGSKAWWIHGACWLLFLSIQPWNLIWALPGALLISYTAHKLQNTTVILIARILATAPVLYRIVQGVLG